jgi:FkbM family methyltransferase
MGRVTAKAIIQSALAAVWLREGTARRSWFGPYRGLTFGLRGAGATRLGVFYRAYEQNVTDWLRTAVRPGMTVYVIGAHVGIHVLYIARLLGGQGRIYAFEGWPDNFQILEWNISLNPQLGVEIVPLQQCVARQSGTVVMAQGSADGKHHIAGAGDDRHKILEVAATSLDDFWQQAEQCPDLILMDIEGYELDALQGGERMFQNCKPLLVLEHHDRAGDLLRWLEQHGYTVETHDKRHLFTREQAERGS